MFWINNINNNILYYVSKNEFVLLGKNISHFAVNGIMP